MNDPLTKLPNRDRLQLAVEAALRNGAGGALLYIDLDHFKYVNDAYGHRVGDQLLIGVKGVLRAFLGERSGELYRPGGDEFVVHLPGGRRETAIEIAEGMLDAICRYRFATGGQHPISNLSASIGIALYPLHGNDLPSLLSSADIATYRAKELGRNRYVLFSPGAGGLRGTHLRVHGAQKLRDALDEDRVVLFSQPVVRLADRLPVHHEILARIRDCDGRHLLPGNFIELAESLGLIQEVDLRVVDSLLRYMARNGQNARKLRYFVNLSRKSICDQRWIARLMSLMRASPVDPGQLVFEITETAAMSEVDATLAFVRRLKDMGCRFGLDGFGAGFSSFHYLRRFEVDYLKIDGGFVRDLATDEGNRVFVKALSDVARGLHKQVIAEWVESPDVLKVLLEMGAEYGQGYLFQRPLPLTDLVEEITVPAPILRIA